MYREALTILIDTNPVLSRVKDAVNRVLSRPVYRYLVFVLAAVFITMGVTYAQTANTDAFYNKISELLTGGFGKGVALVGMLLGAILIFLNQIAVGILVILGALLIALAPTVITFIFS